MGSITNKKGIIDTSNLMSIVSIECIDITAISIVKNKILLMDTNKPNTYRQNQK